MEVWELNQLARWTAQLLYARRLYLLSFQLPDEYDLRDLTSTSLIQTNLGDVATSVQAVLEKRCPRVTGPQWLNQNLHILVEMCSDEEMTWFWFSRGRDDDSSPNDAVEDCDTVKALSEWYDSVFADDIGIYSCIVQ